MQLEEKKLKILAREFNLSREALIGKVKNLPGEKIERDKDRDF